MTSLNKKAFTLVEVLISIVVVGIALVSVALVFSQSIFLLSEIRQRSIASEAVQDEMESIRNMSFGQILALGPAFVGPGFGRLTNPVGAVTVDDPFGVNDMRRVTVTVSWTSSQGVVLSRSLATLVTRDGINKQ